MSIIYNMDCIRGSKQLLADESVDLIITDPPYNLGYGGTGQRRVKQTGFGLFANDNLTDREYRRFTISWIREAYRVLRPGRHIYVCIDWRNYPLLYWMLQHVGFTVKNCIVWDKVHMGMGWQYRYRHEFIILAMKEVHKGRYRRKAPHPRRKPQKNRRIVSRSLTDVWKIPKLSGNKMIHPTEKPVELIVPMIVQSSQPGEHVVDFFVGSGPVYEAAISNSRLFTGFEISEDHYNSAIKRVKEDPYYESNNTDET